MHYYNDGRSCSIRCYGLIASICNVTTNAVVRSGIISYILAFLNIPFVGNLTP